MNKKTLICTGLSIATAGVIAGIYTTIKLANKAFNGQLAQMDRAESYLELLNGWLYKKNRQQSVEEFFIKHQYHTIAIYGYSDIGQRFYEEIRNLNEVKAAYIIDQNADNIIAEIPVYKPGKDLPDADAIIVTPIFAYIEIESMLKELVQIPVLSIEDVINDNVINDNVSS